MMSGWLMAFGQITNELMAIVRMLSDQAVIYCPSVLLRSQDWDDMAFRIGTAEELDSLQ